MRTRLLNRFILPLILGGNVVLACAATKLNDGVKVGLVICGGGAKSIAAVGVYKFLVKRGIRIHFVAGTSMGAVIGAMIALRYSPEDIEREILQLSWNDLIRDESPRRQLTMDKKPFDQRHLFVIPMRKLKPVWPVGLYDGQQITKLLSRITLPAHGVSNMRDMPVPFACVATDVASLEAVVLDIGFIVENIQASLSIPLVFTPVRINGRLLSDGSSFLNFPAEVVKNLGANFVIGVDVGTHSRDVNELNSLVEILSHLTKLRSRVDTVQYQHVDVLIRPEVQRYGFSDFDKAAEIIAEGEHTAHEAFKHWQGDIESLKPTNGTAFTKMPNVDDSIFVNVLEFKGLSPHLHELAVDELCLNPPVNMTIAQVESAIDRLFALQHFERIGYPFHANEEGGKLIFRFSERVPQSFQFGLRYDRERALSMLLGTAIYNVTGTPSSVLVNLHVGRNLSLEANYYTHFGFSPRTGFHFRGLIQRSYLGLYENGRRLGELEQRSLSAEAFWGAYYSRSILVAFGMKSGWANLKPHTFSEGSEPQTHVSFIPALKIQIDTRDRTVYARRGVLLEGESEHVRLLRGASGYADELTRHHLDFNALLPIGSKLSVLMRAQAGKTSSANVPVNYQFHLGGFDSFAGYHPQELRGSQMLAGALGLQLEFMRNKFLLLQWNQGNVSDDWTNLLEERNFVWGAGISAAMLTPIGPIEIGGMAGAHHSFLFDLGLGYRF